MTEGLLYEPRSFWSIGNFTPEGALTPRRIRLPREHFFNGERYPIQIKRLVVSSINYGFMSDVPAGGFTTNPTGYHESTANMNTVEVAISAPQRYHLSAKRTVLSAAIAPRPRWTPRPRLGDPTIPGAPPIPARYSSLWGQSMLKLDMPIYLPQQATIEWALSAHTPFGNLAGGEADAPTDVRPFATLLYQESGGNVWPGSARTTPPTTDPFRSGFPLQFLSAAAIAGVPPDPQERWPYPPDASFVGGYLGGAPAFWPPQQIFTGKQFDAQESTRSGSTCITDMRAFIDQRAYDERMQLVFATPAQPTPMSLRTGTRIRTVNGGTKAWWWRPGAPLALVFDAITPANVYELPEPITLGPEEHLEVEVVFPGAFPADPDPLQPSAYHLGLSLNGYAAIEG